MVQTEVDASVEGHSDLVVVSPSGVDSKMGVNFEITKHIKTPHLKPYLTLQIGQYEEKTSVSYVNTPVLSGRLTQWNVRPLLVLQ